MTLTSWSFVAMIAVLATACRGSLNCQRNGAIEQDGVCTCPPQTVPDQDGIRCISLDGGTSDSPETSDGSVTWLGMDWDGKVAELTADAGDTANADGGPANSGDVQDTNTANSGSEQLSSMGNCPPGACSPGTCVSTNADYSCECPVGYLGTGDRSCRDYDECGRSDNDCSSAFPCLNQPGTYTCVGRYADWPMPEIGQRRPVYSGTDEVLIDEVTGLSWQNPVPSTYPGCSGVRQLSDDDGALTSDDPMAPDGPQGSTCTWIDASRYCEWLTLGGNGDWRLPSAIEALSLVHAFEFSMQAGQRFWLINGVSDGVIAPHFDVPRANGDTDATHSVRCIRGVGKNAGQPHYTISEDGTEVTDNRTELTWERNLSASPLNFADAQTYCSLSGRMLPTAKELYTLYDAQLITGGVTSWAVDIDVFPHQDIADSQPDYWSSSDVSPYYELIGLPAIAPGTYYMTVGIERPLFLPDDVGSVNYVRCVRQAT